MITTNRNVLIGGHTTQSVKDAVKEEARRLGKSTSAYVHWILHREMVALGYKVKDEQK